MLALKAFENILAAKNLLPVGCDLTIEFFTINKSDRSVLSIVKN